MSQYDYDSTIEELLPGEVHSPERNLWNAVLLAFLKDVEMNKRRIREAQALKKDGATIWEMEMERQDLLKQLDAEWFGMICDWAGQDYERFKNDAERVMDGEIEIKDSDLKRGC